MAVGVLPPRGKRNGEAECQNAKGTVHAVGEAKHESLGSVVRGPVLALVCGFPTWTRSHKGAA